MTLEQIEHWFTYHPPTAEQQQAYQEIRDAAKDIAGILNTLVPESADKTAAFRKLRECVMTANAAIALAGSITNT